MYVYVIVIFSRIDNREAVPTANGPESPDVIAHRRLLCRLLRYVLGEIAGEWQMVKSFRRRKNFRLSPVSLSSPFSKMYVRGDECIFFDGQGRWVANEVTNLRRARNRSRRSRRIPPRCSQAIYL